MFWRTFSRLPATSVSRRERWCSKKALEEVVEAMPVIEGYRAWSFCVVEMLLEDAPGDLRSAFGCRGSFELPVPECAALRRVISSTLHNHHIMLDR